LASSYAWIWSRGQSLTIGYDWAIDVDKQVMGSISVALCESRVEIHYRSLGQFGLPPDLPRRYCDVLSYPRESSYAQLPPSFSVAGFEIIDVHPPKTTLRQVFIPYWMISVSSALLPLGFAVKRFRRRIPAGYCQKCGYDLRASTDRCPECGEILR
jgi:hypothetical protein